MSQDAVSCPLCAKLIPTGEHTSVTPNGDIQAAVTAHMIAEHNYIKPGSK